MAELTRHPAPHAGKLTAPAALTPAHDVSRFACGQTDLDDWLRTRALDSEGQTARTYVVCESGQIVVGYYCIAMGSVQRRDLPAKAKRVRGLPNQIPIAIIGRLARDRRYKGWGLGQDLVQDALKRILAVSQMIGVRAVLVHALDDTAAAFWRQFEFVEWPAESRTFYLPIETIAEAV